MLYLFFIQPSAHSAVIKYCFITLSSDKPLAATLVKTHSDMTDDNRQTLFFSLRPPGLRQQPTKQPNFYFYKLCGASTPGRGLKRQWWKADKLCNQTSQGNAHYCVFFFMLVCLAFPILSLLFIPQWQTALAHLRTASLGNIALFSIWYASPSCWLKILLLQCARTDTATFKWGFKSLRLYPFFHSCGCFVKSQFCSEKDSVAGMKGSFG